MSELSFAKFDYWLFLRGRQTHLKPGKQNIMAWLTERGGKLILIFKICNRRGRAISQKEGDKMNLRVNKSEKRLILALLANERNASMAQGGR